MQVTLKEITFSDSHFLDRKGDRLDSVVLTLPFTLPFLPGYSEGFLKELLLNRVRQEVSKRLYAISESSQTQEHSYTNIVFAEVSFRYGGKKYIPLLVGSESNPMSGNVYCVVLAGSRIKTLLLVDTLDQFTLIKKTVDHLKREKNSQLETTEVGFQVEPGYQVEIDVDQEIELLLNPSRPEIQERSFDINELFYVPRAEYRRDRKPGGWFTFKAYNREFSYPPITASKGNADRTFQYDSVVIEVDSGLVDMLDKFFKKQKNGFEDFKFKREGRKFTLYELYTIGGFNKEGMWDPTNQKAKLLGLAIGESRRVKQLVEGVLRELTSGEVYHLTYPNADNSEVNPEVRQYFDVIHLGQQNAKGNVFKDNNLGIVPKNQILTRKENQAKMTPRERELTIQLLEAKLERLSGGKVKYINEDRSITDSEIEYFSYLNDLRDSGATNMFGAAPRLEQEFGIDRGTARSVLGLWMKNFNDKGYDEGMTIKESAGIKKIFSKDLDEAKKKAKKLSDVKVEKGAMHKALGLKPGEKVIDVYTSGTKLANDLVNKVGLKKAKGMLAFPANINPENNVFDKALKALGKAVEKKTDKKEVKK